MLMIEDVSLCRLADSDGTAGISVMVVVGSGVDAPDLEGAREAILIRDDEGCERRGGGGVRLESQIGRAHV